MAEDPGEEAVLYLEAGAEQVHQPRVMVQKLLQSSPQVNSLANRPVGGMVGLNVASWWA